MSDQAIEQALRDRLAAADAADGAPALLPLLSGLTMRDGIATLTFELPVPGFADPEALRLRAERIAMATPGVGGARVVVTAHRGATPRPPARAGAPDRRPSAPLTLEGVTHVIAVASGKGGVGKSTVAANLALGLARAGWRTGLLDADIYGPSVPHLLGLTDKPESDGKRLFPLERFGIKAMSIGLLVDVDTPMIWRGAMVMSALSQMLADVAWAPLDVLVVDMPPGTGDAQLTLAQRVRLSGAVIVSTPQDLALIDARKAIAMFERTAVPVLGLVENMSLFHCPQCGHVAPVFGHGGARATAETRGIPVLGEIPLAMEVREASDAGAPIVATSPGAPAALAFLEVAARVAAALSAAAPRPAPRIRFIA